MTKEQKQVLIAKSMGWRTPNPNHYRNSTTVQPTWMHCPEWDGKKHSATSTPLKIPDYFEDLNEVAKLRKRLSRDQRDHFVREVQLSTAGDFHEDEWLFASIDSTAEKQAEAYGIVLGLWR